MDNLREKMKKAVDFLDSLKLPNGSFFKL